MQLGWAGPSPPALEQPCGIRTSAHHGKGQEEEEGRSRHCVLGCSWYAAVDGLCSGPSSLEMEKSNG